MAGLRRSRRAGNISYDSNGRDYLASVIGCSQTTLSTWLLSPAALTHLQMWHRLCISGRRRFNDALSWINTGQTGYYYDASGLEEDLLLMCLGEGRENGLNSTKYARDDLQVITWTTQELWARTAWRIAQGTFGNDGVFEKAFRNNEAAKYALTIDVLCIAFHSIAFRGRASVWERVINGGTLMAPQLRPLSMLPALQPKASRTEQVKNEAEHGDFNTSTPNTSHVIILRPSLLAATASQDHVGVNNTQTSTKASAGYAFQQCASPTDDMPGTNTLHATVMKLQDAHVGPSQMGFLPPPVSMGEGNDSESLIDAGVHSDGILDLVDENGSPITGYRRAAK